MKKLLIFLVLVGYTSLNYSQTLIQTFTDRCTGATQVFQIAMTGTTTVVFYNRSQSFTAADVQSGAFQAWLEETYAWWSSLNPCSSAQAESTTAQQTTQQTTAAASQAATNAAAAPPPPPPPPPNTSSTTNTGSNATSNTTDTGSSTTSGNTSSSTDSSQSSDTSSTSSGESSQNENSDTGGGGESTEDSGGGETTESESESTEETSSEESSESESESEEEVSEEESSEEDSDSEEESEEESNEDSDDNEEEEEEEKKKNLAPPILAANIMSMQMLDGTWSTAASFGISQSSLTGQETYSANAMIWSNFKQFSLALSKSKVHFWRDKVTYTEIFNSSPKSKVEGNKHKENLVHHVGSTTINYMNIFGTNVITSGYSHVILGQEDNFWKGFAGGYAAMGSLIILPESLLLSPSLTFFGTKPINFRALPRWGFAPMLAVSLTPIQLDYKENKVNVVWNEYFNYIIGTNANFNLTQRFVANLGINTINNTNPVIPTTFAVTIGARFAF